MQPRPEDEPKKGKKPVLRPDDVKKLAELGIMRALPKVKADDILKQGRLMGRIMNLENACTKEMKSVKDGEQLYKDNKDTILKLLNIFGEITGWLNKGVHLVVGATFCLKIVEGSKFEYSPKITQNLQDIIEYYERGGLKPDECYEEAYPVAVEAWNSLVVCKNSDIMAIGGCDEDKTETMG